MLRLMQQMYLEGKLNPVQSQFMSLHGRPAEEFYDVRSDPHEVNNLAGDPLHQMKLEKYRMILAEWIQETGDQGETSEPSEVTQREYHVMMQRYAAWRRSSEVP